MKSERDISIQNNRAGSTLVFALLMLAILGFVGANVLTTVTNRYNYTEKAVGWQEAIDAAEAGADVGLANCRRTLTGGAWTGWKKYDAGTSSWVTVSDTTDANSELSNGNRIIYDLPAGSHLVGTGEGTTDLWYHVEVDVPPTFVVSDNRWYRIRSTGYAGLPGLARSGNDRPDGAGTHNEMLRKLDLRVDHFIQRYGDYAHAAGTAVAVTPQATRRVEMVAQPVTPFTRAVMTMAPAGSPLNVPLVDSYNSTDTVNYPGGLYSSAPRNPAAGIGTNATIYVNAPISSLSGNYYGNVSTNGGTLTSSGNISGTVTNNAQITAPPVTVPSWAVTATSAAPSTLTAGTSASPLYASYSSINNLTVNLPAGQTSGVANIYITGNVTGGLTVAKGVTVRIWFAGDFSMKSRDIDNLNNNSAYLQLYGIDPPAGETRSFSLGSGTPQFTYFTLDAPGYDFDNNGNPDICGAFVVKTLGGNGNTTWHYDEALGGAGIPTDYKRAMWVEDER